MIEILQLGQQLWASAVAASVRIIDLKSTSLRAHPPAAPSAGRASSTSKDMDNATLSFFRDVAPRRFGKGQRGSTQESTYG
jgi:hypothetical protein